MIMKIIWMIIVIVTVILFALFGIYAIYFSEPGEISLELDDFRMVVNNATCADITNELFVIDNQIVFWVTEGNCPDASYTYPLFDNTPN